MVAFVERESCPGEFLRSGTRRNVTNALGESVAAEQHFKHALTLQPEFAEGYFYHGQWLLQQARAAEAIPQLQRALALSPALLQARTLLLDLCAAQGTQAALSTLVRETLALSPNDSMALAYASREKMAEVNPFNAQHFYNRGLALTNAGRHLHAALAYRQAQRLDPSSADIANNLGWSLGKIGFYKEAIANFEEAVRLRPGFTLAQNNLRWAQSQAISNQVNRARTRRLP